MALGSGSGSETPVVVVGAGSRTGAIEIIRAGSDRNTKPKVTVHNFLLQNVPIQ
jgi:hypothetical protein